MESLKSSGLLADENIMAPVEWLKMPSREQRSIPASTEE
jgi:hypothetical protein